MSIVESKPQQLENRTLDFAANIIAFCKELPITPENKIIINQLIRAASSVGANYTEANNASSRSDFKNKIFIAKKEASEARYWLRLAVKSNIQLDADPLISEVAELIFIFQKIISTLKNGK